MRCSCHPSCPTPALGWTVLLMSRLTPALQCSALHCTALHCTALHCRGIVAQLVLDCQPFTLVESRGFLLDKRLTMPELKIHSRRYYVDKVDQVMDEDC